MRANRELTVHQPAPGIIALTLALLILLSSTAAAALSRQWKIFVNQDSHVDIGYTGDQETLRKQTFPRYLDSLFAFIERSNSWDENSKVRCCIESSYWLYGSALTGPRNADWVERLKAYIAAGRISYSATLGNMAQENCGAEELVRTNYYSQRFLHDMLGGGSSGILMMADNPGITWSAVNAMTGAGVNYCILRTPGWPWSNTRDLASLQGQDPNNRLLVWNGPYYPTDDFGLLGSDATAAFNSIVQKCQSLEGSVSYPYDAMLVDLTAMGDNTALSWRLYDNIHKINALGNSNPKVILASPRAFFAYVDSTYTTFSRNWRGSIENWWNYGVGSAAHDNALARTAHERLPAAEMYSTLASIITPGVTYPYENIADGYFNTVLWDEHTWAPYPWKQKTAFAASALSDTLLRRSTIEIGKLVGTSGMTIIVNNYLSQDRTDIVKVKRDGFPQFFDIINNSSGAAVPYQSTTADEIAFVASGIPALGYATFSVRQRSDSPSWPANVAASGKVLEGRFYRVTIGTRGQMTSIIDKLHNNTELIDQASDTGANSFLYIISKTNQSPIVSSYMVASATLQCSAGSVFGSITAIGRTTGVDSMARTIILYDSLPRIDIVNSMIKSHAPSGNDEEGYFIFPLRMPNFQVYHEICSGVMRPGFDQVQLDQYSGSCTDYYTVNRWIDASNQTDYGITLATPDAPIVEYGMRRTSAMSVNYRTARPWVFSYVFNNKWGTNFPEDQAGPVTIRYSLESHGGGSWVTGNAQEFGAGFANPMPCVVIKGPQAGDARFASARGRLIEINAPNVALMALKPAEANGSGTILRFNETHGLQTTATINASLLNPNSVIETDLVENDKAAVQLAGGSFSFTIGPFGWKAFRVLSPGAVPQVNGVTAATSAAGTLVTWQIPSGAVSFYEVFRGTSETFIPGAGNYLGSTSVNRYTDNQLTSACARRYYYKVRAVSGGAKGPFSGITGRVALPGFSSALQPILNCRSGPVPSLSFSVPSTGHVRIEIINASGRTVAAPVNAVMKPGSYRASLFSHGARPAKGFFCVRMRAGNTVLTTMALAIQ